MMTRRIRRRPRRRKRLLWAGLLLGLLILTYLTVFQRWMQYLRYPLREEQLIVQTAQEYELEPWHVAAVILCESSFNRRACSSAGARGLMQLMPETGEWIAQKLGNSDFSEDSLYEAETNVRYGCWYLRYLLDRYDGDKRLATAAYHAGPGRVDGWLEDPSVSPDGITLPEIPYRSTAAYVERVASVSAIYEELYDFEE